MKSSLEAVAKMAVAFFVLISMTAFPALASSHAEAPLTSMDRYADNTDVYAFRSTENGRAGYVTLIANFVPFQDPSGGPQFFRFDDTVLYAINIDNTGDGVADVSYQFRFETQVLNPNTAYGHTTLNEDGVVMSLTDADYNMPQTYTVVRIVGSGPAQQIISRRLRTPPSNVGPRVTPNYETNLGSAAVYVLKNGGRVFAGQRDEGFFIDVGAVFDGLGFRSIAATGGVDTLRGFNVNSLALEIPIGDLTRSGGVPTDPTAPDAVIGVWSTASRQSTRVINPSQIVNSGPFRQISRLGNPLVNEAIIPLGLKDAFNMSDPTMDSVAAPYVLNPELPRLIQAIFGLYGPLGGPPITIDIPTAPRNDLAQIFALGIPAGAIPSAPTFTTVIAGTNGPHEYMRLNVAFPPAAFPNRLGLLGGDVAGFPNGRRVGDDVVDIELRAALGGTPLTSTFNRPPNNSIGDGVAANFEGFLNRFPYLQTPNQGNTPRPTNFPATQTRPAGELADFPIVDADGNLVRR